MRRGDRRRAPDWLPGPGWYEAVPDVGDRHLTECVTWWDGARWSSWARLLPAGLPEVRGAYVDSVGVPWVFDGTDWWAGDDRATVTGTPTPPMTTLHVQEVGP